MTGAASARSAPTRHGLDPAGARGIRQLSVVLVVLAFGWGLVNSVVDIAGGAEPVLTGLGSALFGAACGLVVHASAFSSNSRLRLDRRVHALVGALVVIAYGISASVRGSSENLSTDPWRTIGIGIVVLAIAPYRPPREVVSVGVVIAACVGVITFIHSDQGGAMTPSAALAVVSATGVLAPSLGSAMFARRTIEALQRWQYRADIASEALAEELRENIAQSVYRDRITILNRDVVPFFTDVLRRGDLTDEDRATARAIATSIREVMVADADRSWLTAVVERDARRHRSSNIVDDPGLLAASMDIRARTALRATIGALVDDENVVEGFSVTLGRNDEGCAGILSARIDSSEHAVRARYDPFFAVMKLAFSQFSLDFQESDLIVRFSYERP